MRRRSEKMTSATMGQLLSIPLLLAGLALLLYALRREKRPA